MGKSITAAEMAALSEDGDYFEAIDDGKRSIQGFDELIAQIKDLVAAQRANAGADMMRSEAQSELTALMQKLMSRPVAETDMSVLAEALTEISAMRTDHKAYKFTVERDNQGFMQQIIAVPITPTQH